MDLFDLFIKIKVDDQASDNVSSLSTKLGNGLKTAAKIGTAAVSAAAAGVAYLTKKSVESYAEYEQLIGGVETLFKQSASKVEQYANNAFKTAGMSANDYMSTVTSFSASLLQSVGGDTDKAAEYANEAITDMADNANKMGTDIQMIQNAYQGFAKQNYTMLDNLKLGYGGTKEEMERLIKDAAKLDSSINANSLSFSNITKAIHVVQTQLGITGTTAKEAASTIQGSVSMMKAAWQNMLTGIADDTQDFDALVSNLVESVVTVADNVMPRIEQALNGIGMLIEGLAPVIGERLPSMIASVLPSLVSAAGSLVTSFVSALPGLMSAVDQVVPMIVQIIIETLPLLAEAAVQIIISLVNGISSNLPSLMPAAVEMIIQIVNILTSPDTLTALIEAAVAIIMALADGLIASLPQLISAAPVIVQNLVSALSNNAPLLIESAIQLIFALVDGIIANLPAVAASAMDIVLSLINGIMSLISYLIENGGQIIGGIVDGIKAALPNLVNAGKDVVNKIKQGISEAWDSLSSWFNGIWNSLFGNRNVDVSVNAVSSNKNTTAIDGSHAGGLAYVPFDGYIAQLHKGERVLTAQESRAYSRPSVTVNQAIYSQAKTAADLMQEAYLKQREAVWLGV